DCARNSLGALICSNSFLDLSSETIAERKPRYRQMSGSSFYRRPSSSKKATFQLSRLSRPLETEGVSTLKSARLSSRLNAIFAGNGRSVKRKSSLRDRSNSG